MVVSKLTVVRKGAIYEKKFVCGNFLLSDNCIWGL